jgi:hypothetical protein
VFCSWFAGSVFPRSQNRDPSTGSGQAFDNARDRLRGTWLLLYYGVYIRDALQMSGWKSRENQRKRGESRLSWRRGDNAGGPLADPDGTPTGGAVPDTRMNGPSAVHSRSPNARDPSASSGQARGHPQRGLEISPGPGPPAVFENAVVQVYARADVDVRGTAGLETRATF